MNRTAPPRAPYRGETKLVISIDFGTTFSGTSWVLLEDGQVPQIWDVTGFEGQEHIQVPKVPTVLYYDNTGKLRAAGGQTLDRGTIAQAVREQWTRVEWFKLLLRPDSLAQQLQNAPETEIPPNKRLVTVIADFLRYMHNLALEHFHQAMDTGGKTWDELKDQVVYILSHPNGWNTFQHPVMREAAILAGLVPNSDQGNSRIIFVSEGEASLHWCMSRGIGRGDLEVGSHFIVVDAGGGTIDISSFKTVDTLPLKFEESSVPDCFLQGSALVTKAFKTFVQEKLRGSSFRDPEIIERMVDDFDREVKCKFRDPKQDMSVKFGRHQDNDIEFGIKAGCLLVHGEEMARFYDPACSTIVSCLNSKISKIPPKSKTTIVLVGGFAGNEYLYKEIQRRFSKFSVLRPNDATAKASANGVICFHLDRTVKARMAKWTYGVPCVHDYDPKDPKHLARLSRVKTNPVTGKQLIEGGFFATLKKGTVVEETELTRFPFWHSQSTRTATTLEISLECYQGNLLDIKFRDEDKEGACAFDSARLEMTHTTRQDQFQEVCWFKATISENALVPIPQTASKRNALSRPTQHYYVSNFHIVLSFGATEFKCHIEWKDENGAIQRGPVTPIWHDEPSGMLSVRNSQKKVQQHSPTSPSSTVRPPDSPVSSGEVKGLDLALVSPRPWEGDNKGLQFLKYQSVCSPKLIIGTTEDWVISASSGMLLFTLPSKVIIYNTERKTARTISYGFHVKSTSVAHTLSPDGKSMVRWILDDEIQTSTLLAFDARSKKLIAELQQSYPFQQCDILDAIWVDNFTIYVPVSAEGIVIPWNIRDDVPQDNDPKDLEVVEPLPSITSHRILKFEMTKNRLWWTATGLTFDAVPSGVIEVHDVENDESSTEEGMVSCVAEVEVNDREKALLVSAGITQDFKLQLCVRQLDSSDSEQPFAQVNVKIDTIEEKDYPRDIVVLHPLPIVAVMTEKFYIYFFELNTGAFLYSEEQKSYRYCPGQSDKRQLLLWSCEKSDVQVLTVNEGDLIRYCRKVLKNDRLADAMTRQTSSAGA
ncbi:hypothetical protein FRC03_009916 [Tulasnella sp. 419]|nr:hypothetical protein FRC03_009916 [Tulasnella sp. 419]